MRRKLCTAVLTLALLCTLAPSALAFDTAYVGRTETLGRGLTYSVMLDENGTLLGVGQGGYYELGWIYVYGGTGGAAPILSGVLSLSAGPVHAGAIDRNGGLWMWGRNDSGEIGNGQEGWYDEGLQSLIQREPVQVLDHVAAVSCGWGNTAAIRTDGTLWVWGDALYCGNGGVGNAVDEAGVFPLQTVPMQIMEDVAAVSVGGGASAALKTDGTLWTWGGSDDGMTGSGDGYDTVWQDPETGESWRIQLEPVQIMEDVVAFSMGNSHGAAVKSDGTLWTWGTNDCGELGTGDLEPSDVPVQVLDRVADVNAGSGYTAAIRTDGTLWTWGSNLLGELGNGTEENSLVPVQVLEDVAAVQTGIDGYLNQTAAVRTDGSLWTWGADGELWGEWTLSSTVPVEQTDLRIQLPMSTAEAKARLAWYSEQPVAVNGGAETLSSYVLLDENGYETNYIGLGQLYALMVDRTAMTIEAGERLNVTTDAPELSMTGDRFDPALGASRAYRPAAVTAYVDGQPHTLSAIVFTDDGGTEYTYYKLRDLGLALGFDVGWSAGTRVTVDFPPPGAE